MTFHDSRTLLRHDIYGGIIRRWQYYLIAALFFSFATVSFVHNVHLYSRFANTSEIIGIPDLLINMFAGNLPFDPDTNKGIKLSLVWFIFHAFLSLIVGFYLRDDLKKSACPIILRVKSKARWWTSKFLWCILTVLAYYFVLILSTCIFSLIFGDTSSGGNVIICNTFSNIYIGDTGFFEGVTVFFLLPLAISIAVSAFQIAISLLLKPIYSFLLVIIYLVASAFYCNPILIFNFTMISRNASFSRNVSITAEAGFCSALCLTIVSYFLGLVLVKKKDIL